MASQPRDISQYQNLSNNVKSSQKEPMLDPEYIYQVFKDFGYEPTNADMHYWTNMKESQKAQLVKNLKTRRDDEDGQQKEHNKKLEESQIKENEENSGPKHLSEQKIKALYSEYGLPTPDIDWVRKHLPDNEELLRGILQQEAKHIEAATKISSKQELDGMKNQVSGQGGPGTTNDNWGGSSRQDGQGGAPTGSIADFNKWNNHFVGKHSLIQFTDDPDGPTGNASAKTIWLLDNEDKVLRPFLSMEAFNAAFSNPQEALAQIAKVSTSEITKDGFAGQFDLLGSDYGINKDLQIKPIEASRGTLSSRYGEDYNEKSVVRAVGVLDGLIGAAQKDPNSGMTPAFLTSTKNDPRKMAALTNGLAFGGYTPNDAYRELMRQQQVANGDEYFSKVKIMDPKINAQEYKYSKDGQMAYNLPQINPPASIGDLDMEQLKFKIFDIPDDAFKLLSPLQDINSEAFKAEMSKIKDYVHDLAMAKIDADTDAAKSVADDNWARFKTEVEKKYGIALKDNAMNAWKQLEAMEQSFSERGIGDSGMQTFEQMQMSRENVADAAQLRDSKMTEESNAEMSYYKNSASPAEIQKMIDEDVAKGLPREQWRATKWGLTFTAEDKAALQADLKAKYPKESPEDIAKRLESFMDENGNRRSVLYQDKTDKEVSEWYTFMDESKKKIMAADDEKKKREADTWENPDITKGTSTYDKLDAMDTGTKPPDALDEAAKKEQLQKIIANKTPAGTPDGLKDNRGPQKVAFTQWDPATGEIRASKAGESFANKNWQLWTGGPAKTSAIGGKQYANKALADAERAKMNKSKTPVNTTKGAVLITDPNKIKDYNITGTGVGAKPGSTGLYGTLNKVVSQTNTKTGVTTPVKTQPKVEVPKGMTTAATAPSSVKTATNTIAGYDQSGQQVYVAPGYNKGISATKPTVTQPAPTGIKRNLAAEQAYVKTSGGKNSPAQVNQAVYGTATPKFL